MQTCPCDSYYIDYCGRICRKKCCDINVHYIPYNLEWGKVNGESCEHGTDGVNVYVDGKVVFAKSLSITEVAEVITFLAGKK